MFKDKKKLQKDDNDILYRILKVFSKTCSFSEKNVNGRKIVTIKELKLVQIINTEEDYEKYSKIMQIYINYVKNKYTKEATLEGCDLRKCFQQEISVVNEKLPLFFVYKNDVFIGMTGVTSVKNIKLNNNTCVLQELSLRIFNENGDVSIFNSLNVCITIISYAIYKNFNYFMKTYVKRRDFWFHLSDIVGFYYIGTKVCKFNFLQKETKMDIFSSVKNIELT